MRTRSIIVAAVAALSLLAACGSEDEASSTTAAEGATETTTGDTAVEASGEHADEEFCQFQEELNNTDSPLNGDAATPEEIEAFFTDTVGPAIDQLTATAPDEMADAAATMATAYGKLSDLFEQNGWDLQKAINDPALAELAADQDFGAAANAIDTYCGF